MLSKGSIKPLFEKEGQGEIYSTNFWNTTLASSALRLSEIDGFHRIFLPEVDMINRATLERQREAIFKIAASHGARNLRIFGSVARGQAKESSDLDVLITLERGHSLLDLVAIKQDLEDLLGCSVNVVTEDAVSPYIRKQVLKDAVGL